MLLNNEWVKNEFKEQIKKFLETKENEHKRLQNLRHSESSLQREVRSNTGLPKKDINISNEQPNHTSVRTGGTTTKEAQSE